MMTFAEIAQSLGVKTYPPLLESIYEEVKQGVKPPFDLALMERHQRERNLFGDCYEAAVAGLEDLQAKPEAMAFATVAALYMQRVEHREMAKLILPKPDGSPALDMLPVMVLLPMVDHGLSEYQRRGTSKEDAEKLISSLTANIRGNIRRNGRPGLDQVYFNWNTLMSYGLLFPCQGFKFNISNVGQNKYVLRNKETREVALLLHEQEVHRSGGILGAAGLKDQEGSFHIQVTETETEWTGYPTDENGVITNVLHHYPKTEWEATVLPGDCSLSIHLPAGMKLEKNATRKAIAAAFDHAKRYYPDYDPKALICASWILNPELKDVLKEGSNILAFASLFHIHPTRNMGTGVFQFVFKTSVNPDLNTLAEDTSLQRALKAKYLAGGYHLNYGGVLLPDEV